jgi:hypothetical protein
MKIDRHALSSLIYEHDIEWVYSLLSYDYKAEVIFSKRPDNDSCRTEFLDKMAWTDKPTSVKIKRLFNQINSFYAEKWAQSNPNISALDFLLECNKLILFRQGKMLGYRSVEIEFGVRADVDFLDPRGQFKQLRGTTFSLIDRAVELWGEAVECGSGNADLVLALVISLIAIHPFSDGNGRLGRVAYTWLRARWGLPAEWLAEDEEGEFFRTGMGLASTEYLMAAAMLKVCAGYNRVLYGQGWDDEDGKAFEALKTTLQHLRAQDSLVDTESFRKLRLHLQQEGHIRKSSPRFESLRDVLQ